MSDKPVFMTSRELATRLLRDSTDFEVSHVATALEEMASWHMERRGRTPTFDRAAVIKEVREMNLSESIRQGIITAVNRTKHGTPSRT